MLIISDIDYCAELPCLNNGTCIDLLNDYNCNCMDGFSGANCTNSRLFFTMRCKFLVCE